MKLSATLLRFSSVCLAIALLPTSAHAQPKSETTSANAALPDTLSQGELLKSYLNVRDQLHSAELAIANNRLEAEAQARAQNAAISEKLDSLKSALAAERDRQQLEARQATLERERLQAEAQRWNRTVLWVATGFGGAGLLAMLFAAALQWRAINRLAEVTALRPLVAPPTPLSLNAGDAALDRTVGESNQRLMSVINRMEQRIFELENTADRPSPADPNTTQTLPVNRPPGQTPPPVEQDPLITVLLAKGRLSLNANRAREALVSYDELLKINPAHAEALVKKGIAHERLKQDLEALECYDRAIKADPKMTLAYLHKGGVCNRLERYNEALACYEEALQAEEAGRVTSTV